MLTVSYRDGLVTSFIIDGEDCARLLQALYFSPEPLMDKETFALVQRLIAGYNPGPYYNEPREVTRVELGDEPNVAF